MGRFRQLDADASASSFALRWVGSFPGVKVILSGMSTMEQVEDNLKTFTPFKPLSQEERAVAEDVAANHQDARVQNGVYGLPVLHALSCGSGYSRVLCRMEHLPHVPELQCCKMEMGEGNRPGASGEELYQVRKMRGGLSSEAFDPRGSGKSPGGSGQKGNDFVITTRITTENTTFHVESSIFFLHFQGYNKYAGTTREL